MPESTLSLPERIAIVGGHGKIALALAELLVADGVEVRSLVRNADHAAELEALGAIPVVCDIESASANELADAFGHSDAVVFAAGAGPGSGAERKWTVDRDGSIKSAEAAILAGAMRFVQISFIGAEQPSQTDDEVFAAYWDAKREADEALRRVALDWTIVKPGGLTDDPATGRGLVSFAPIERGVTTRRADVAAFIRLALADSRTVWKDICLAEGDAPLADAIDAAVAAATPQA
ncbi:NAD(P)H-binding protein [Gulosibacter sp. ACHW.36C]|uniref:NAD(P)H-binding protein n=1 Tax=Gulosibacter sediminis TaxID=1729695 RepID=A0ABY4MTN1_9MICO|nr:NAD(P)H-binding protein [Gulosibacter sediminis]UQN13719.1 NAD(P)H-binding protein [Gulosibacter sediminis]